MPGIALIVQRHPVNAPAVYRPRSHDRLHPAGPNPVRIPDALDPSEGFVRFIEWPDGRRERYAPPMRTCMRAASVRVTSDSAVRASHPIPPSLASRGPIFTVPGTYRIWAVGRTEDMFRESIPPNGLFGEVGLDRPAVAPTAPLSPFIVVKTLKGKSSFADVVCWNIQHFHGSTKKGRVQKSRSTWTRSAATSGAAGNRRRGGRRARRRAQRARSAAVRLLRSAGERTAERLYLPDGHDSVSMLEAPKGLFDGKGSVIKKGEQQTVAVFPRDPFICDVRVTGAQARPSTSAAPSSTPNRRIRISRTKGSACAARRRRRRSRSGWPTASPKAARKTFS